MDDHLTLPKIPLSGEFEKFRSFSTSTPITNWTNEGCVPPRSLSVSVCDDSGYADSLADSATGFAGANFDAVSCSVTVTPVVHTKTTAFSNFRDSSVDSSPSPFRLCSNFQRQDSVESSCHPNNGSEVIDFQSIPKLTFDDPEDSDFCEFQHGTLGFEEKFDKVLEKLSSKEPDRMIGRKMGLECVDVISELQNRSMATLTGMIMQYLDPQDLCRMCLVSKSWMSACSSNRKANKCRLSYLQLRTPYISGKENNVKKRLGSFDRGLTDSAERLAPVQCLGRSLQPIASPCHVGTQRDIFAQVADSLKNDEQLKKCPKCQSPSKVFPVQERGRCQNFKCSFDYCVRCFNGFHGSRSCTSMSTKRAKTDSICGRKSKKNLRRL